MILGRQSGLGRGLGAIIPPKPPQAAEIPNSKFQILDHQTSSIEHQTTDGEHGTSIRMVPLHLVDANPHQPREHFDHAGMEDLASSIKEHGVIQPIVVTETPDGRYELIAGERRTRAAKIAGLESIPAMVRSATEQQKLEMALIENVQRRDLNPLEEARAYIRLQTEFNLTQDDIGIRVGKSRPHVGNIIRLLQLPQEIQDALAQGRISASNARTILSLPTESERMELFRAMLAGNFTVRQTEARVSHPRRTHIQDPNVAAVEQQLRESLGTKVTIKRDARGEGEIRIAFLNEEDLQGIVGKIRG